MAYHKSLNAESWNPHARRYDPIAVASIDGSDKEPHDKAVLRALDSVYVPNQRLPGNAKLTLFIGRLHPNITSEELLDAFQEFGEIKSCNVVRDIVTRRSKQYAFIEYLKERHADRAYRYGHKMLLRGAEILVEWEAGRTMPGWKPRSLGGGFGGRKESGQLRFGCRDRPWERPITGKCLLVMRPASQFFPAHYISHKSYSDKAGD